VCGEAQKLEFCRRNDNKEEEEAADAGVLA
jgi:hypothetical protein